MRIFAAYNFDDEAAELIEDSQKKIQSVLDSIFRWEAKEKYHITLKFIGDVSQDLFENIKIVLNDAGKLFSEFEIILGVNCGVFPCYKKPSVVWIGLECKSKKLDIIFFAKFI